MDLLIMVLVNLLLTYFKANNLVNGLQHAYRGNRKLTTAKYSHGVKNITLSTATDCARQCRENEPPKICYYKFTVELYPTMGGACTLCTPDGNMIKPNCQCILGDGYERIMLAINRMLPGPSIQVCEFDKVVIDVVNAMSGLELTLHWHGITQKGTQFYDGVPFLTQCPINSGNTFRYKWLAYPSGTHFYHSHSGGQKIDGLYGSIVVRQPPSREIHYDLYDYDLLNHLIVLSDWNHENAIEKFPGRSNRDPGQLPDSVLINGLGRMTTENGSYVSDTPFTVFTVERNKKYRFRMITAMATVCPVEVTIEGHNMLLIYTDGEPVRPVETSTIVSFSGERHDFIINTNRSVNSYWIQARAIGECYERRLSQLAILQYADDKTGVPATPIPTYDNNLPQNVVYNRFNALCDSTKTKDTICVDELLGLREGDPDLFIDKVDVKIFLAFRFQVYDLETVYELGTYRKFYVPGSGTHMVSVINNITYSSPPYPLVSQFADNDVKTFCNDDNRPPADQCNPVCSCAHMISVPLNSMVQLIVADEVRITNLSHPMHLHGHQFYVTQVGRSEDMKGLRSTLAAVIEQENRGLIKRKFLQGQLPPAKDTVAVPSNGFISVRFKADNPGFWLLHCHFLFHILAGMNIILQVGNPSDLPPVPNGFPKCGNYVPNIV